MRKLRTRVVDLLLNDGNHLFVVLLRLRRHELVLQKHGLVRAVQILHNLREHGGARCDALGGRVAQLLREFCATRSADTPPYAMRDTS